MKKMVRVLCFEICEYIIILSTLYLRGIHAQPHQNLTNGYTNCTTHGGSPLVFEGINLDQFKELQERFKNVTDDHYVCDLGDDENCDSWWNVEDWYKVNSISSGTTEHLTDERWQGLEVLQLENRYKKLFSLDNGSHLVPISWNFSEKAEVLFCTEETILEQSCLEIKFTEDYRTRYFGKNFNILIKREKGQNIEWQGIIWKLDGRSFKLLNYIHGGLIAKKEVLYRHLFGRSNVPGDFLKIHNYNFLRTEKAGLYQIGRPFRTEKGEICITMYVAMCRNCRMIFIMSEIQIAEVWHVREDTWKNIMINIHGSPNQYEQLYVSTIGDENDNEERNNWAIDFVRKCSDERFITIRGDYKCVFPFPHVPPERYNKSLNKVLKPVSREIDFFRVTSFTNGTISYMLKLEDNVPKDDVYSTRCFSTESFLKATNETLHKCSLWPNYLCASFKLIESDYPHFYPLVGSCDVYTMKRHMGRAYFSLDEFFLKNKRAGAPNNMKEMIRSNRNAIYIAWTHPFVENGPLTGFQIKMIKANSTQKHLKQHTLFYNITKPKSRYYFSSNFTDYESCDEYFIQVRAINRNGLGFATTKLITAPPLLPTIKIEKRRTANICTFFMRILNEKTRKCLDKYDYFGQFIVILVPVTKRSSNSSYEMNESEILLPRKYSELLPRKYSDFYSIIKIYKIENYKKKTKFENLLGDLRTLRPKNSEDGFELLTAPVNSIEKDDLVILEIVIHDDHFGYYEHKFNLYSLVGKFQWKAIILGGLIFSAVVGILVCSLYGSRMCKKNKKKKIIRVVTRPTTIENIYFLSDRVKLLDTEFLKTAIRLEEPSENSYEIPQERIDEASQDNSDPKPVRIVDFEKYVKISMTNKELTTQFQSLPTKPTKFCQAGKLEYNKPKNRFQDILPYDDSRVKLQTMKNKEGSDYINASYILGHQKKKSYIAAQGPKSLTINDFWRMVWQENVRNIIMLVNLADSGVKKVEKYWPDPKEDFQFGKIHIYHHSYETWADYEIRVFRLVCDGSERKIHQYHFQNWPDNGVPIPFQSLIPFIRKTMEINTKSPILVHCCSGTSATGAFILCHTGLQMAYRNGVIDIFKVAKQLREQRVNMIHNLAQYKLVHLLICEYLFGLQLAITCADDLNVLVEKLTRTEELKLQMSYLEDLSWQYRALFDNSDYEQLFTVYPQKNKTEDIVPDALGAIELEKYPVKDESSCYINAISVEGYRCRQRYIVTQQPMPNTLNDFWRMVIQKNVKVVISLNNIILKDKKSCTVWPTEDNPVMSPVDFIIIKHQSSVINDLYDVVEVLVMVQGKEKKSMNVTIADLKGWKPRVLLPENVQDFLKFCGFVDSITRQMKNTVVTCYDGCLASGIYVAASYLIEMIKVQKSFDVCSAVRAIRTNRTQFITEEKQLAFLYEIASTYIKGYQDYANFGACGQACLNIYDYIEWTNDQNYAECI